MIKHCKLYQLLINREGGPMQMVENSEVLVLRYLSVVTSKGISVQS